MSVYRVKEIFGPSIQGEGDNCGKLCFFVRMAGCDQRPACKWCDTMDAYSQTCGVEMSEGDIISKLEDLGISKHPVRVIFTGGNPCIQNMAPLVHKLNGLYGDVEICVETQGTVFPEWLDGVSRVVVSPKPPSATGVDGQDITELVNYVWRKCKTILDRCKVHQIEPHMQVTAPSVVDVFQHVEVKVVVFTVEDYRYALRVFEAVEHVIDGMIADGSKERAYFTYTMQIGTPTEHMGEYTKVRSLGTAEYPDIVSVPNEEMDLAFGIECDKKDVHNFRVIGYDAVDSNGKHCSGVFDEQELTHHRVDNNVVWNVFEVEYPTPSGVLKDAIRVVLDTHKCILSATRTGDDATNGHIARIKITGELRYERNDAKIALLSANDLVRMIVVESNLTNSIVSRMRVLPQVHRIVNVQ